MCDVCVHEFVCFCVSMRVCDSPFITERRGSCGKAESEKQYRERERDRERERQRLRDRQVVG